MFCFFFLNVLRPPGSTPTYTLLPYTTLVRSEAVVDLVAVASGERAQLCMQTANPFWITLSGIAVMDAVDLEVRQAGRHHGEGVGFGDQRGGEDSHARRSSQRLRVRPPCSQSPLTCPSSRSSDRMPTVGTGIGHVAVSLSA